MIKLPITLLALLLGCSGALCSAPLLNETFDNLNPGNLVGQGGWSRNGDGTALVATGPHLPYSAPHYLTLGSGGAVQHSFAPVDLSVQSATFGFHFLSATSVAGRNIQLSIRAAASGAESIFALNLLGSGTGLQAGVNTASQVSYSYVTPLQQETWYYFTATTDVEAAMLHFSVVPSAGGEALVSGSVDLSSSALKAERLVFSSNSSTQADDWALDNIMVATTIPEPSATALGLGGLGLAALWRLRKAHPAKGDGSR